MYLWSILLSQEYKTVIIQGNSELCGGNFLFKIMFNITFKDYTFEKWFIISKKKIVLIAERLKADYIFSECSYYTLRA